MVARAASLAAGATASSRSRKTKSASDWAALAIIFSLVPGVDNSERRSRLGGSCGGPSSHDAGRSGGVLAAGQVGSPFQQHGPLALEHDAAVVGDAPVPDAHDAACCGWRTSRTSVSA